MNFLCVLSVVVVGLSNYANAQWYTANCPNGYQIQSGDSYYAISGSNYYKSCAFINANPSLNPCNLQVGQCINIPSSWTSTTCPSSCTASCCGSAPASNTYGNYYGSGTTGYWGNYAGNYTYGGCSNGQYMVQPGNTFYSLGGSTAAGMCAWRNANPSLDPCNLQIGQCINQPSSSTSTLCSSSYCSTYSCGYVYPTGSSGYYTGPTYGSFSSATSCNCGANQYCVQSGDTLCKLAGYNTATMCSWLNANSGIISNANSIWVGQCINDPNYYASTSRNYACPSNAPVC